MAAKKKSAKKKAAKKKAAKKKTAKKKAVGYTVDIVGGRAHPGTRDMNHGDKVKWHNQDGADYVVRFSYSPFKAGRKHHDIPVPAYGDSKVVKPHSSKHRRGFHYDIFRVDASGKLDIVLTKMPPGEPQVVVGD